MREERGNCRALPFLAAAGNARRTFFLLFACTIGVGMQDIARRLSLSPLT